MILFVAFWNNVKVNIQSKIERDKKNAKNLERSICNCYIVIDD